MNPHPEKAVLDDLIWWLESIIHIAGALAVVVGLLSIPAASNPESPIPLITPFALIAFAIFLWTGWGCVHLIKRVADRLDRIVDLLEQKEVKP